MFPPLVGMGLLLSLMSLSVDVAQNCDKFAPLWGESVKFGGAPRGGLSALGQFFDVPLLLPVGHDGTSAGWCEGGEECFVGQLFADPLVLLDGPELREEEPRLRGVDCEGRIPACLGGR